MGDVTGMMSKRKSSGRDRGKARTDGRRGEVEMMSEEENEQAGER